MARIALEGNIAAGMTWPTGLILQENLHSWVFLKAIMFRLYVYLSLCQNGVELATQLPRRPPRWRRTTPRVLRKTEVSFSCSALLTPIRKPS
jgi:hypothetical protein